MKVAFGFKAHSGWAALVVLGRSRDEFVLVERRRVELVEQMWAKQPYHAAEGLKSDIAGELVQRGIDAAYRIANREVGAAVAEQRELKNKVTSCAVLVGNPMPEWSTDEILAVHFRMHQAEGVLFRKALLNAARECGLKAVEAPEKTIMTHAEKALGLTANTLTQQLTAFGKLTGPPWGKDQKDAALAAMLALA